VYYYAHALLAAAGRSRDGGREVLGCNWGYRNTVPRRAFTKAHEPTTGMLVDVLRAAAPGAAMHAHACVLLACAGGRALSCRPR